MDRAVQRIPAQPRLVPDEPPRPGRGSGAHRRARTAQVTHVLTIVNAGPAPADPRARAGTRTSSSPTTASAASRRPTRRIRSCSTARPSATSRPRRSRKLKGGNSNWRGPIWFPTCFLLIESLRKLGKAFGPQGAVAPPAPLSSPSRSAKRRSRSPTGSSASSRATRDRPPRRSRRRAEVPGRSPLARSDSLLRVLPRRQGRRPGRIAPDRLDGPGRLADRRVARALENTDLGQPPVRATQLIETTSTMARI